MDTTIDCTHDNKKLWHKREGIETFEACRRCADKEVNHPEYWHECPHCGAGLPVN